MNRIIAFQQSCPLPPSKPESFPCWTRCAPARKNIRWTKRYWPGRQAVPHGIHSGLCDMIVAIHHHPQKIIRLLGMSRILGHCAKQRQQPGELFRIVGRRRHKPGKRLSVIKFPVANPPDKVGHHRVVGAVRIGKSPVILQHIIRSDRSFSSWRRMRPNQSTARRTRSRTSPNRRFRPGLHRTEPASDGRRKPMPSI